MSGCAHEWDGRGGRLVCRHCGEGLDLLRILSEKSALKDRVRDLEADRDSLRKALLHASEMHRRAQRLEGIEAHMETLRESHRRELGLIMQRAQNDGNLWWSRYRALRGPRAGALINGTSGRGRNRRAQVVRPAKEWARAD